MPRILDGNRVRDEIKSELKPRVDALAAQGRPPGLAVVLVGNNPASEIYVRNKIKTCRDLGIYSESITPPDSISTAELLAIVEGLNARAEIDGILVQLPLPAQVDTKRILMAVAPAKDVDGFHPCNVGALVAGLPAPRACTPAGIIELLKRGGIPIAGRRAVIVGRSDIVGKPVAMLLLHEHATVTICHSKTPDLPAVCREADILVAAIGRAAMITRDFIREGATVIDVGTNYIKDRGLAARIFRNSAEKLASFDQKGSVLVGRRGPDRCGGTCRGVHPGSGGSRAADHCDADGQYSGFSRTPPGRMLKVGLTGGIASGKSFVGEALAGYGCLLVHADELGHAALAAGGEAYEPVVQEFGREILTSEGAIDRRALASRVFGDPARLARLNALVHPAVFRREDELIAAFAAQHPDGIAVVEAAILIETGSYSRFDKLILVTCTEEQQVERALRREGAQECDIRARISRQMPLAEKRKYADFVIDTSGEKEDTLRQTRAVYDALRRIQS